MSVRDGTNRCARHFRVNVILTAFAEFHSTANSIGLIIYFMVIFLPYTGPYLTVQLCSHTVDLLALLMSCTCGARIQYLFQVENGETCKWLALRPIYILYVVSMNDNKKVWLLSQKKSFVPPFSIIYTAALQHHLFLLHYVDSLYVHHNRSRTSTQEVTFTEDVFLVPACSDSRNLGSSSLSLPLDFAVSLRVSETR